MKTNENEILTIAGKKVVVRYARTQDDACASCAFCDRKECHDLDCNMRDIIGESVGRYAYFVEAEQPEEEAPAREANPFVQDQGLTIDGKRYVKRYFRIGDACSRCAFKVGEDAKGHARCKDHGKPEKPCTPDREKGVLVYFVAADQLQEEIHSLQEWAKIMAERPELRAEFDKMCPPQPIQGSVAPEADLEAEIDKKVQELHTAPCYNELAAFARHFVAVGATMDAKKKRVTMSGFYSPISPNRLVNIPDLANKGALFQDAGFEPGEPVEITIEAHNPKHNK